jgi:hypothetical protein
MTSKMFNSSPSGGQAQQHHKDPEEEAEESPNQILYTESDFTGNLNTAATQFSIDYTAPENALNFDAINDIVTVPHTSALSLVDFTIEGWVKTTQTAGN